MEAIDASQAIIRKLWDFDKFCFNKCVKVPEKKFSVKEENCLKHCTTKVLNALDFMNSFNEKGGLERASPQKSL